VNPKLSTFRDLVLRRHLRHRDVTSDYLQHIESRRERSRDAEEDEGAQLDLTWWRPADFFAICGNAAEFDTLAARYKFS